MNRYIRNRLRMIGNVLTHFDEHPDVWAAEAPVAVEVDALRDARARMDAAAESQAESDTRGHTRTKNAARDHAEALLAELSRKVRPYAVKAGDGALLQAVDRSPTEWDRLTDADLVTEADDALTRTEAALPDLAPYKVTAGDLTAARDAVARVPRLARARDNVGADRGVATDDLDALYDAAARPPLTALDDLVPALLPDDAFAAEYARVRRIPGD